jgi:hypothetical protein
VLGDDGYAAPRLSKVDLLQTFEQILTDGLGTCLLVEVDRQAVSPEPLEHPPGGLAIVAGERDRYVPPQLG